MPTAVYCTQADLRAQLGDSGNRLAGADLDDVAQEASREIDQMCGRHFFIDSVASVRLYRPRFDDVAWISDVGSLTGLVVQVGGANTAWITWTLGTQFQLEPINADSVPTNPYAWWRIRTLGIGSWSNAGSLDLGPTLKITALHGWSSVPAAIRRAAIIRAVAIYKRRDSPQGVAAWGELGAYRIGQDRDVMSLVAPFVKPSAVG